MGACFSQDDPAEHRVAVGAGVSHRDSSQEAVEALLAFRDCTSKLEVHIQCRKLKGKDGVFGKSDPFCVLYEQHGSQWVEIGRTEVAVNQHDVDFVKAFKVSYNFEARQPMRVKVFDMDQKLPTADSADLSKQDYLGAIDFEVAELARAPSQQLSKPLGDRPSASGTLTVVAEEMVNFKKEMTFTVRGHHLANKDGWGGKSDPFLRVHRSKETSTGQLWQPVLQSGTIMNNLNPVWTDIHVALGRLCGGDLKSPLLWQVLDYDRDGRHPIIGKARASVEDVVALSKNGNTLDLMHPSKKAVVTGQLSFPKVAISDTFTFLDYLQHGVSIDFYVAIDFTASNGAPKDPSSLHYRGSESLTQYELAIQGIASILDFYNPSKQYTAWGFGASVSGGATNHCYPLNGNFKDPRVSGTAGILEAYRGMLRNCRLSGPTNFSPVIEATMAAARASPPTRYSCLLILTDGEITDLEKTISTIVEASDLPMSILIVGVGNASFESMDALDSDDKRLTDHTTRRVASRDIVQFVPFNRFNCNGTALASQVLAELPGQLVEYMRKRGIQPSSLQPTVPLV